MLRTVPVFSWSLILSHGSFMIRMVPPFSGTSTGFLIRADGGAKAPSLVVIASVRWLSWVYIWARFAARV